MKKSIFSILVFVFILSFSDGPAFGLESFIVGPRAMGMGGANVASVSDTTAQYYNPAAFGFFALQELNGDRMGNDNNNLGRKDWGLDINAAGGYRLHNDLGRYLDDLARIDHDALGLSGIQNESDLTNLVSLINDLAGVDEPGNAISVDVNGGFGLRVLHFGIGTHVFSQATGRVKSLDTTNLGIFSGADLSTDINNVTVTGNDGLTLLFTSDQQTQLSAAGLDAAAIQKLDYLARQQNVDPALVQDMVDLFAGVSTQSGSNTLGNNTTTIVLEGFAHLEVPVTYGRALNRHWSVGGNLKFMKGRVYGTEVVVFDKDSGEVIEGADDNYEDSTNFGLDLGVMGRFKWLNLGLVARNLNSPTFDGPTVNGTKFSDVTIDPQVTAGVAFLPFETLTLEADIDLTSNETALKGYDSQNLAIGLEWDVFRVLALRAGTYRNLAENDIKWVYTAGLGLNLWLVRFDIAGTLTDEKEEFDGDEIPKEVRVAGQLSIDF